MPANFPEIWVKRVIQNLDKTDVATFLEGIAELDVDVTAINEGTLSEKNKIYVAETEFEVDVLINNTTYPIPVQVYEDGTIEINLDKFNTKVTTLKDDDTMGASYKKIDVVTKSHIRSISSSKYKKAIHSIAPTNHTDKTPVFKVTGGKEALKDATGRLICTYEDLVEFKRLCEGWGDNIRLVLCDKHWNDLLTDRKNFGNQLVDYVKGKPNPKILGFEIHTYEGMPSYTAAGVKKPYGAISESTDRLASVAFVKENIAKKTGITKQYFTPAATNPHGQTNDLNYRHYFVVVPFKAIKIGALI